MKMTLTRRLTEQQEWTGDEGKECHWDGEPSAGVRQ